MKKLSIIFLLQISFPVEVGEENEHEDILNRQQPCPKLWVCTVFCKSSTDKVNS